MTRIHQGGCNIKHCLLINAGLHVDENLVGEKYVDSSNIVPAPCHTGDGWVRTAPGILVLEELDHKCGKVPIYAYMRILEEAMEGRMGLAC